jgi:hypothetical protein
LKNSNAKLSKRRQAEAVLHEYLGLAAIYLGVSKYLN